MQKMDPRPGQKQFEWWEADLKAGVSRRLVAPVQLISSVCKIIQYTSIVL